MKVAFLCCILLLAGSASCSPVEPDSSLYDIYIPDWIADLIAKLPESIQNIINRLPEIIAAIPDIIDRIPEIIDLIIEKIPEVIPIILDKLPEIIAQVPALIDRIRAIVQRIIERIPELIPIILEKIPEIIEAIPGIIERIKEIYDLIKDKLDELDLPDWFPTLPELEKPEWWPDELPELPEYNKAVAGTPTTVNEYPSIVQIEVGTGPVWVQGCAGTILTNFHVATAARCLSGRRFDTRFRRVRAGATSRYTDGSIVNLQSVTLHPDFSRDSFDADIAVIRLNNALVLGATIQQSPIVPQDFSLPTGLGVVAVGWGSTAQGRRIADRDLYQIDLVTISNEDCSGRWSRIPLFTITSNMICAGRPETGGRNGDIRDIGAPIYYQGILSGIQTLSAPIGNQRLPVVATNVASYTNWILATAV